jgi:hypothetical protein
MVDGVEMARYTKFERAGHSGVRGRDRNGNVEEYGDRSAHSLAEETALALAKGNASRVIVLRDDGTIAIEVRS